MLAYSLSVTLALAQFLPCTPAGDPTVKVINGSLSGIYDSQYDQIQYLGIKYAQTTGGDNRFRVPQSLNGSWDGVRPATQYSHSCPDMNPADEIHGMSEDCLSINIVKPASMGPDTRLPIMFWIHGGSWQEGTSGLAQYNMTWLVQRSVEIGKPIMGVSINYRGGVWGNLFSNEILGTGNANLGLRDILKSLEWVQENIAAFGGDPNSVTIWGESSGAFAVGQLMIAYGGKTSGLFHRTIQQSGSAGSAWYNGTDDYQAKYDKIVSQVNCSSAIDTLNCLRAVPYETLLPFTNYYLDNGPLFYPTVDGDIIPAFPSQLLSDGKFSHVPHLLGCNSDEGANSYPFGNVSADEQLFGALMRQGWRYPEEVAREIMRLYPDDPTVGVPVDTGRERFAEYGSMYKRASAIFGDVYYHGPLLVDARYFSKYNPESTYVYRFNTRGFVNQTYFDSETNTTVIDDKGHLVAAYLGVSHTTEIPFVFQNPDGVGPWSEYKKLSKEMSAAWISFAHSGNPNLNEPVAANPGVMKVKWPVYGSSGHGTLGKMVVLQTDKQGGIYVEDDKYRLEGREYLQKWTRRRRT